MVHNLPENFNISDFDVFHSALTTSYDPYFAQSKNLIMLIWHICPKIQKMFKTT